MSVGTIFKPCICEMENFDNLFIELTAKVCNQRCKNCYIDFPYSKTAKDFIDVNKIKQALNENFDKNIKKIYLMGAEPMCHPEFNTILRLCLKHSDVVICTNASFINEKKIRFLKKVEDEGNFKIIFNLSLDHYDEIKNDKSRYRGAFRHTIFAIKNIMKADFETYLFVNNFYKEDKKELLKNMKELFLKNDLSVKRIKINDFYDKFNSDFDIITKCKNTDCKNGRVLTDKGIYTCPFLSNDNRGRMGSDLKNFSKKCFLDTDFCSICVKNEKSFFSI